VVKRRRFATIQDSNDGLREAFATCRVHSEFVIALCDVFQEPCEGGGCVLSIVTEYAEGGDLLRYLSGRQPSTSTIIKYLFEIVCGLCAIHEQGFIHRDLKAENVFVRGNGSLLIGDFGVASISKKNNDIVGSSLYMAPELNKHYVEIDKGPCRAASFSSAVDIWSLGILALELACGNISRSKDNNPLGDEAAKDTSWTAESILNLLPKEMLDQLGPFILACLQRLPHMRPTSSSLKDHPLFYYLRKDTCGGSASRLLLGIVNSCDFAEASAVLSSVCCVMQPYAWALGEISVVDRARVLSHVLHMQLSYSANVRAVYRRNTIVGVCATFNGGRDNEWLGMSRFRTGKVRSVSQRLNKYWSRAFSDKKALLQEQNIVNWVQLVTAVWHKDIFDHMVKFACRDSDEGDYSLIVMCSEDALVRSLLEFGFVCYLKVQQEVPAFLLVRKPRLTSCNVYAVDEGSTVTTWQERLERNFDPNVQFQSGIMPLYNACIRRDEDLAFLLLRYGANVNRSNVNAGRDVPMHACGIAGSTRIAEVLIQNGARLDVCNANGATPLHVAAENGSIAICQQMLACADVDDVVNVPDQFGASPLYVASVNGHHAVVRSLLAQKADTTIAVLESGNTPLHGAAFQGHYSICKVLLENGASVSHTSRNGFTPLHVAAFVGHTKIVMLLLRHGASKEIKSNRGLVPLHVASNEDIVKLLSVSQQFSPEDITNAYASTSQRVARARIVSVPWIGARRKSQVETVNK
jgi:ankyrin repeat protein